MNNTIKVDLCTRKLFHLVEFSTWVFAILLAPLKDKASSPRVTKLNKARSIICTD